MGHEIICWDYPKTTKITDICADAREYASRYSDSGGLYESITDLSYKIFPSYEEAKNFCYSQKSYWNGIVSYRQGDYSKSKQWVALHEEIIMLREKYNHLQDQPHFTELTSQFVGCTECGSKINRVKLGRRNVCPVCCADLRPKTVLNKLDKIKKDIDKVKEDLVKLEKKLDETGEIRLLIKFEFHV
ncbi:MAG: hypothetical protein J6S67_07385 [Methanobrevibacter sp.]|nr:hypothetical protein [Methanobrevibacter sp.]